MSHEQTINLEDRCMPSLSARIFLRVPSEGLPRNATNASAARGRLLIPMGPRMRSVLPSTSTPHEPPLDPADPAIHAVTDFTREHPMTVDAERQIDDALRDMIGKGVRALLVVKDQSVIGLITSYDIQGEKPMQFLQSSNYSRHQDIRVGDIMTPWGELQGVDWRGIQSARIRDLERLFEETQLTHLIVIETDHGAPAVVRGLISHRRLLRQLVGTKHTG